jgi:hypothetical protein
MKFLPTFAALWLVALFLSGCASAPPAADHALVGAWRGHVQFKNGAFAEVKDLEFLYAFNAGGTMTESSNYDGVPPVAPAYGVWRKGGDGTYEARYEYFWTKAPATFDEIAKGGGWMPGGRGVLVQTITLSADGNSFDSMIKFTTLDAQGKATDPVSEASAHGVRIQF